MALLQMNWSPSRGIDPGALPETLAVLPPGARITVMTHGYRFSPGHAHHDPHDHILGNAPQRPCWKAVSWPRHLHLGRNAAHLGIAFGWPARGRLRCVAARAFDAGRVLADLLSGIHARRPDLRLSLIAHSLGVRVALSALAHTQATSLRRLVLLSGAEYRDIAARALGTAAGSQVSVLNVRSAQNLPFDMLFRAAVPAPQLGAAPLSAGLPDVTPWIDLSIECARTRAALSDRGLRIAAPRARISHWSTYLCPGVFAIYRRVLDPDDHTILGHLRHASAQNPGSAAGLFPAIGRPSRLATAPFRADL